ncbi:hypothetical protein [Leptospira borgpetersenii]|uniref:hypothetical protein n=1 Tax=Leptospira borgpetersenii TaxID=174 RepID=UPI000773337F|nr:hypothetical protein [Leptospira borgpetersenii]MBE8363816.1 hypothetical protein [Leptospira borgpetersenii serovar Balcanica]MBE8366721.1 hypothetical protein [Leptospira borgpetersenii serovar Balcanica]MBE8401677.1 hypothetical protein [Leptospira borgpetersenii serovar Tarassovi]MBE8404669.1 hypothetical protein [Leptospira borgpetersenii serovar Tarassovi]MBE8405455.1 hypothetical protein [Leptospira borgpetersenii serovar Tarassovi]
MEFKRKFFFTVTLLAVFLMLFLIFWPESSKKQPLPISEEKDTISKTKYYSEMDPYYPDLPHPFNEDPELEVQAKKLWPEAFRPKMTLEEKEEIQREWTDFIARYPKNLYIPAELRPPLTEAEEKELRERLDTFTDVESRNISVRFLEKYSEPGKEPELSSESNVTPKEQLVYINYKIKELESRIQLIEYTIEQKKLDSDQMEIAKQDLMDWKDELSELKQVQSQIPRS